VPLPNNGLKQKLKRCLILLWKMFTAILFFFSAFSFQVMCLQMDNKADRQIGRQDPECGL